MNASFNTETLSYKHNTSPLSKEQELILGTLIQAGLRAQEVLKENKNLNDEQIRNLKMSIKDGARATEELVAANVNLVYNRAYRYKKNFPAGPELEDIIQYGMCGLMTAVQKYDPARENKFSTIAYAWIMQAIGRETNKNFRLVRLPENRIDDFSKINKVHNKYAALDLTSSQIDEKISQETGLPMSEINSIRNAAGYHTSLNRSVSYGSGETSELMDIIGETLSEESAEKNVMREELAKVLSEKLTSLNEMQRDIVFSSFAIDNGEGVMKPKDVREKHGISAARYKKICAEVLGSLKTEFRSMGLRFTDFLD